MAQSDWDRLEQQKAYIPDWKLIMEEAPAVGLQLLLEDQGRGYLGSPFTQFLLTNLGRQGALQNLSAVFQPFDTPQGPSEVGNLYDFTEGIVQSIFDPKAPNPLGVDLGSYLDLGRTIYGILTGTGPGGQGAVRQGIEEGGFTPSQIAARIEGLIDTFGAFSMSSLQRNLMKTGLRKMEVEYMRHLRDNNLSAAEYRFDQFLIDRAADWLLKWWKELAGQEEQSGGGAGANAAS